VNNHVMREHWYSAADGTRLFACDVGPLDNGLVPLLCLPGLTRNAKDFEPVFSQFGITRRIIAMDFRGRGRSACAADAMTYRPDVELQDTLGFLDALQIDRVAVLGTSRGGIVGLLMATMAKQRLAGLCLNDIGCKLETAGLLRIMTYLGTAVSYPTWEAAAESFSQSAVGFGSVSTSQWLSVVKRIYRENENGIEQNYDLNLARTRPAVQDVIDGKLPDLWALLPALTDTPFALLRGEGSDLLSTQTVERMVSEVPDLVATTIRGRGHVPFLDEPESISAISAWLARVDLRT
jgi:pimeloyl-ACP methyl ester carboxylesterase